MSPDLRQTPGISRHKVILFYLILGGAGFGWAALQGRNPFFTERGSQVHDAASALLGVGMGILVVGLSRLASRHFSWAKALDQELQKLLGTLSTTDILIFAGCSGVAEELFFRGAMQPVFGLIPTSILFGLLHLGPNRKFLAWPFLATVIGLGFGLLFSLTGALMAPILAHFTINFFNLSHLRRTAPPQHTITPNI